MPITWKLHTYMSKEVWIRGYFSKTKWSVVSNVWVMLMYKRAQNSFVGQRGGEREEIVEVEEYSRNKQDQTLAYATAGIVLS